MFSKSDFIKYFNQVSEIEEKMVENMDELLGIMNEGAVVATLTEIRNDEVRHVHILDEIKRMIHARGR